MSGKKLENNIKIIAEIASSHNGSIKNLKKISDIAVKQNSDYLKFQIFKNRNLCHKKSKYFKGLNKIEIDHSEWEKIIKKYEKKINLILEPFDEESYFFCKRFNKKNFIKISSSEQDNQIIIKDAIKSFKKVFINISGYSISEIQRKFGHLNKNKVILMYGYQNFPTNLNKTRLKIINELKKKNFFLGYADHSEVKDPSLTYLGCCIALQNGATYIEKHITLDRKKKLPDYISSFEELEFKQFIKYFKNFFKILNNNTISKDEKTYKNEMGKHAVFSRSLRANVKISNLDIKFLRTKVKGLSRSFFFTGDKIKNIKTRQYCKKDTLVILKNIIFKKN